MINDISKELLIAKEKLYDERINQSENKENLKNNILDILLSIITFFGASISQALIIFLICIFPKVMVIFLSVYIMFQVLLSIPYICEFFKAITSDKEYSDYVTDSAEYSPFFLISILIYFLATIFLIINLLGVSIPKTIISNYKINELNKTVEEMEKLIKQKEKEESKKEREETKKEEKQENKEEDKKSDFETKVAQDIDALLQICKSIEGKKGIEFLDKLEDISHDFKTRYENISYNMNSKDIDLDQDNYEKLKSDIYGQIAIVGKDMMDYLEAQTKVNKVNSEMDIVIDNIDLLKKEKNQSLVLRR